MAFYRKMQQNANKMWYPRSIITGSASTKQIARHIARGTSLTEADITAVLVALPSAMSFYMSAGQSVKLAGIGSFYYTADTAGQGVATAEDVSPSQIKGIHVRFTPAGTRRANNEFSERPLVSDDIEWIEIP